MFPLQNDNLPEIELDLATSRWRGQYRHTVCLEKYACSSSRDRPCGEVERNSTSLETFDLSVTKVKCLQRKTQGGELKIELPITEASNRLKELKAHGFSSFSFSTTIPKTWLINEENIWDAEIGNKPESIKNKLNFLLRERLIKESGLKYSIEGDCRVSFNFSLSGKEMLKFENNDIFIFGRYLKLVPGISQSRWDCKTCTMENRSKNNENNGNKKKCEDCDGSGKNYESVEEIIGVPFSEAFASKEYTLHASGREDIDVTNVAGRAFVLQLHFAGERQITLSEIAQKVKANGKVEVKDLTIVPRNFSEIVTESHFDKTYEAVILFEQDINEKTIAAIKNLEGKTIAQHTPERVKHRRADLIRYRKIRKIDVLSHSGKTINLRICAEAGTYIKELISGDIGRTNPNIAETAGMGAHAICTKLTVVGTDDGYFDFCLEKTKKI